jgi:hypothetical protein
MAAAHRNVNCLGHQALPPKVRMQLVPDLSAPPFPFEPVKADCTNDGLRVAMLDDPGAPITGGMELGHPPHEPLALSFGWRIRPIGKAGDGRDRQDRQERRGVSEGRDTQRQTLGGQGWELPSRSHKLHTSLLVLISRTLRQIRRAVQLPSVSGLPPTIPQARSVVDGEVPGGRERDRETQRAQIASIVQSVGLKPMQ